MACPKEIQSFNGSGHHWQGFSPLPVRLDAAPLNIAAISDCFRVISPLPMSDDLDPSRKRRRVVNTPVSILQDIVADLMARFPPAEHAPLHAHGIRKAIGLVITPGVPFRSDNVIFSLERCRMFLHFCNFDYAMHHDVLHALIVLRGWLLKNPPPE